MKRFAQLFIIIMLSLSICMPIYANASTYQTKETSKVVSSKLTAPTISVSKYGDSIKIKWKECKGATKYEIYCSEGVNDSYRKIFTTSKTQYTHKKIYSNTKYYYKVRAVNSKYYSKFSKVKSCKIKFEGDIKILEPKAFLIDNNEVEIPIILENCGNEKLEVENAKEAMVNVRLRKVTDNKYYAYIDNWCISFNRAARYLTFKLKGHTKEICSTTLELYPILSNDVNTFKGVPIPSNWTTLKGKISDQNKRFFVYTEEEIKEKYGISMERMALYQKEMLESYSQDFRLVKSEKNEYGGWDEFYENRNGVSMALSTTPNFPQGSCMMIVVF